MSSTVFDFDIVFAAITATDLAAVDQLHANWPVLFYCSCVGSYE